MLSGQRESDGDWYPPTHPSYRKTVPESQRAAQASGFEGQRGVKLGSVLDHMPAPVPTTFDTRYNPDHPKADWAGFVPTETLGKRAFKGHAAQQEGIVNSEDGMVSCVAPISVWDRKRQPVGTSDILRHGNKGIIGGIGAESPWETEARRAASGTGTRRDQMSLSKQVVPRASLSRGGAYNSGQSTPRSDFVEESAMLGEDRFSVGMGGEGSLIGYRAPPQTKSLIAGMAAALLDDVGEGFRPERSAAAVNAGSGGKNIRAAIPGYTGNRGRGI